MAEYHVDEIELRRGDLAFRAFTCGWTENPDGILIVCLHGFPDNARSFRCQWQPFAAAGFRVLSPTLRGYEPSSIPADGDFDLHSLGEDVLAWLDYLGEDQVHLVGHDWGAAISYVAGAIAPEKFLTISTIAVPHAAHLRNAIRKVPRQLLLSWYMSYFQLRGWAEYRVQRNDWALIKKLWRDWSPTFKLADEDWCHLRATFEAPGVKKAMLDYYRQNTDPLVLFGLKKTRVSVLTTVPVPTLAITGAEDGCIDTRLYDFAFVDEDFPNGIRVERVEDAGHFAHQENPSVVNQLILEWITDNRQI